MRRVRTSDVLTAVQEVTGVDPLLDDHCRNTVRSRRLAVHALRDICDLSFPEIAHALRYRDHSTPHYQYSVPVDYDLLREVLRVVSDEVCSE